MVFQPIHDYNHIANNGYIWSRGFLKVKETGGDTMSRLWGNKGQVQTPRPSLRNVYVLLNIKGKTPADHSSYKRAGVANSAWSATVAEGERRRSGIKADASLLIRFRRDHADGYTKRLILSAIVGCSH